MSKGASDAPAALANHLTTCQRVNTAPSDFAYPKVDFGESFLPLDHSILTDYVTGSQAPARGGNSSPKTVHDLKILLVFCNIELDEKAFAITLYLRPAGNFSPRERGSQR
jgi:hypothetical protein